MPLNDLAYELALLGARPLLQLAAPFNSKLKRGLAGQAAAVHELREWSSTSRTSAPLVWVHAPSVGESLMAQAIVQALRAKLPDAQFAFTHFSPSAERMRARVGADVAAYLPPDTSANMNAALDALKPSAIAFVRSEIWSTLTRLAADREIPVLLVNAVLAARSSRLRPLARAALRPSYQRLRAVGAINTATAKRYQQLGVSAQKIRVTGDARFDQVWQRVQQLRPDQELLTRLRDPGVTTIVAGSTWAADERVLLPAFAAIAAKNRVRLISAPHEPTVGHLQQAETAVSALGLSCARLAAIEKTDSPIPTVVLVDRVGVLADLYAIADIAYVGGAFQSSGVHSVVEPAALGVPVVYGPRHGNAEEAEALVRAGGGFVVDDAATLQARLSELLRVRKRSAVGKAAKNFVRSQLGGAQANAALIAEALGAIRSRSR